MIKEAMRLRANCEREELLGPFWCVNLGSIRWKVALIVEAGESFPPVPNGTRENQLLLDCGEENTHRETGWLQFFGTQSKHLELTMYTPVCTITSEGIQTCLQADLRNKQRELQDLEERQQIECLSWSVLLQYILDSQVSWGELTSSKSANFEFCLPWWSWFAT